MNNNFPGGKGDLKLVGYLYTSMNIDYFKILELFDRENADI